MTNEEFNDVREQSIEFHRVYEKEIDQLCVLNRCLYATIDTLEKDNRINKGRYFMLGGCVGFVLAFVATMLGRL
jgi:hypothetical protein